MLRIEVGPADLAATRFALSPLAELEQLLRKIDHPTARFASGRVARRTRWAQRLAGVDDLDLRVLRALRPPRWGPDFIAPPPTGMAQTLAADLAVVRATPTALARRQIRRATAETGPLAADVTAFFAGRAVVARIADVLERLWHLLVGPDWPQLLAIAERDVLHRADRLARGGWAAALDGLHPGLRWDDGAVVVTKMPDQHATLDGRGLLLVPSVFLHPGLATYLDPPWHPAIVYPARGSAALWEERVTTPAALARLLGGARADLLIRLESPASTTQLVRTTGWALGTVGDHLRVLLEAGFVDRGRAGRSVVYHRTAVGDAVVAGASGL